MAILAGRSHPGNPGVALTEAEPPNLTDLVEHEPGVIVRDGQLYTHRGMRIWPLANMPDNVIALIAPNTPMVVLARRLFPPMDERALVTLFLRSRPHGGGVERIIEYSRLARFLLGVAFTRWYCWDEALSVEYQIPLAAVPRFYLNARPQSAYHPNRQYAIGFAPVSALPRWTVAHGDLYTLLWQYVSQLLTQRSQLRAQTRQWMRVELDPPRELLQAAVHQTGRRMGALSPAQAEAMYIGYLAEHSRAPATLIQSRLDGDWRITSLDVWRTISERLVGEFPELALWRAEVAQRRRLPERELLLWLMEPADLLWPV